MQIIENLDTFNSRFKRWPSNEGLVQYPFIENKRAPLTPLRRALPMLNVALISSAGVYIDGTDAFDLTSKDGDMNFREMPIEVEASDLRYAAKGYDASAVEDDRNCQI